MAQPASTQEIFVWDQLYGPGGGSWNDYVNMRSLRLESHSMKGEHADRVLGEAVRSGKLHTFTIIFPELEMSRPDGEQARQHLASYAWLRGSPSITCLKLGDFSFPRYSDTETGPLPDFLATFPNLRVLDINSPHCEEAEFCAIVEGIMKVLAKRGRLKEVFQVRAKGVWMDRLVESGRRKGIAVRNKTMPRTWPVQLS